MPTALKNLLARALRGLALGHLALAGAYAFLLLFAVAAAVGLDHAVTDALRSAASPDLVRLAMTIESLKEPRFLTALGLVSAGLLVGALAASKLLGLLARAVGTAAAPSMRAVPTLGLLAYTGFALARLVGGAYAWEQHLELFDDHAVIRLLAFGHGVLDRFGAVLGRALLVDGVAILALATLAFVKDLAYSSSDRMAMKAS
jgi:hypothetical protein